MNFTWEPVSDREGERDEETERESQERQRKMLEKLGGCQTAFEGKPNKMSGDSPLGKHA